MANNSIPQFKNDPFIVLILGIVTCGLYLIYWNIKAAEVLNAVAEKEVISQPIAIFAGCCTPVQSPPFPCPRCWKAMPSPGNRRRG